MITLEEAEKKALGFAKRKRPRETHHIKGVKSKESGYQIKGTGYYEDEDGRVFSENWSVELDEKGAITSYEFAEPTW